MAVYFLPSSPTDYEGIIFVDEDGTEHRIGRDKWLETGNYHEQALTGRLIGFSAAFDDGGQGFVPIELGVIQDTDSCETAVFEPSTNPFTNIEYMISALTTSSEQ